MCKDFGLIFWISLVDTGFWDITHGSYRYFGCVRGVRNVMFYKDLLDFLG
jgi:hypothetical protein|nr:MAG TPA: hypothetical protein [Bacteriophage sp.]